MMWRYWKYDLLRFFVRFAFKSLIQLEVNGLENIPSSGPLVLVINHVHLLDPPLILATIPRYITVLAASKWQHKAPGILLTALDAIYVDRGEVDREALQKCLETLKQGGVLGLAPEGTRSHTPGMQRARPGVAYIAAKADAPILPVGIVGTDKIFGKLRKLERAQIQINVGPTFKLPPIDKTGSQRRIQLQMAADQIMYRLAELLPRDYQGVYDLEESPEVTWHPLCNLTTKS